MKQLGLMVDCSRNAVLTVDAAKRLVDILSTLGYTYLELYTEDTYEVTGEPHFGCFRGRYSKEEIRELDAYCLAHKMTLKPCIQTLGHLESMFYWGEYDRVRDCVNILLAEDEKTYALIDRMFASLADCYSCREVNIGMDEALLVGHGKYFRRHGAVPPREIMRRHLSRVVGIAEKYGFTCDMWGDLFYHMAYDDLSGEASIEESKKAIPEHVHIIYWDYYHLDGDFYDKRIKEYRALTDKLKFAGGVWTWRGFCPDTTFALHTTESSMRACLENGIEDYLQTAWGDDGAECSVFSALPAIVATAEYARGNFDEEKIAKKFRQVTGMAYDQFRALELPNMLNAVGVCAPNAANYLLYNDPFIGLCDDRVTEGQGTYFADVSARLKAGTTSRKWGYLFKMECALCDVLALKCDLGLRTRRLYLSGDKEGLLALADGDYKEIIRRLRLFYRAYKEHWMHDKKSYGFEVQDGRIGGLLWRMEECARTLRAYAKGEIAHIDELEETPHFAYGEKAAPTAGVIDYRHSFTPAKLCHEFYS